MAKKKLAIAVIHGIGSQGATRPSTTNKLVFSKNLNKRVKREIGNSEFDDTIAWREVFWADILQSRQQTYLKKIKRRTRGDEMRSFVLCNLSDASAYRKTKDDKDTTYQDIHKRVAKTVSDLEKDTEPGAPLIVLAHSLGCHIMSNYIYDMQSRPPRGTSPFQQFKTMGGFITFGCNIPMFTFAYRPGDVIPISYPGVNLPKEQQQSPWWLNFYDKDDILGFPLKDIGPNYEKLVTRKELKETSINAGNVFSFWNPLSHNGYWKDDDFYRPVAKFMKRFL